MINNLPNGASQESRKLDHIELALRAQTTRSDVDQRFDYEPLFSNHPTTATDISQTFLGKKLQVPLWISSMTGGVGPARHLNQNLARVCREFGLGMGLGSCRVLLEDDKYFEDFNLRPILGSELPFFANLGIAQIEKILDEKNSKKLEDLIGRLNADGLIVHINPMQEWFQPEGDRLLFSPIHTLTKLCEVLKTQLIVKEVGQGMGPRSLRALLELPIAGIELGAFGGTNFSKLEILRGVPSDNALINGLSKVGHTAPQMVEVLNSLLGTDKSFGLKQIIISGGVEDMLDGYYLSEILNYTSVIGQAKNFLNHADDYEKLKNFTAKQIMELKMAKAFLVAKN